MLRKLFLILALSAAEAGAATVQRATLIANFDLDGAAGSTTAVHSADTITDAASFTIDAQPDTPRPLVVTVVDADSSITCTYTVVGTKADGSAITATAALGGGSGTKTLSATYNWATVTSASVGTCTGEGGSDTVALGTTSTIPDVYVSAWGAQKKNSQGVNIRDPFSWRTPATPLRVKTAAGGSVTVESYTSSSGALEPVDIGDLIQFNVNGDTIERVIATNADDNTITVNSAVDLSSGVGHFYGYKERYFGPDTDDGWIPVAGYNSLTLHLSIDQMGVTGGIDATIQCRIDGAVDSPATAWTDNYTTTGSDIVTISTMNVDACRVGFGVGTNDDASDSTTETITAKIGLSR